MLSNFCSNSNILIAGVDEAGRGPLAGPVVAAAVILNPLKPINGLTDSKLLSEKKREALFSLIQERALAYAVSYADVQEIDELNILQATLLAMKRALEKILITPHHVLIDGNQLPTINYPAEAIINGDLLIPAISAASILAKVSRDHLMLEYDKHYPVYGFAKHKGYGTKMHYEALKLYGICQIHRRKFVGNEFKK